MDEHNFVLKNGDVLVGPLKIDTNKITHNLDLINKDYFEKNQFVHTGAQPPMDPPFGAIFVHEDSLKEFIYIENVGGAPVWVETSGCSGGGVDGDLFLLRHGDTVDDAPGDVTYTWNQGVTIESENSDVKLKASDTVSAISRSVYVGSTDNTLIEASQGDIFLDTTAGDINIDAMKDVSIIGRDNLSLTGTNSAILKSTSGDVTLEAPGGIEKISRIIAVNDPEKQITNKEYVDTQDNKLQLEIINLQEEIEAITPTIDASIWKDGNSATPGTGRFAMRIPGGTITQNYEESTIDTLIISTTDQKGDVHTFNGEEVGDEIQLFDVEDQNYGLFRIEAIDTQTSSDYVRFTVTHLRGKGSTHVDDDVIIRTFKPVDGGTSDQFVQRIGDDMTGQIIIDDPTKINTQNSLINKGYVDTELFKRDDNIENIEQIQKYFLGIYSKGIYTCPNFVLEGDEPISGEYFPGTADWNDTGYTPKLENFVFNTNFDQVTALKISHTGGSEAKVPLMEVGDFILIQETGTDSGGKYKVLAHRSVNVTPAYESYEEVSVEFVEGFATGNAPANHNAKITLFRESLGDNSDFLIKYGEDVTATAPVNYKWNEEVTIESDKVLSLNGNWVEARGQLMRVISNKSTSDFQSTFYVQSYDGLDTNGNPKYKTMFRVTGSGRVQAGDEYTDAFIATGDNDLTTKKFVDNKFDFSQYTELS